MMNPEIKSKWLAALRSDTYAQARSCLCIVSEGEPAHYCCLGVLCEILGRPKKPDSPGAFCVRFLYDGEAMYPTDDVLASVSLDPAEAVILAEMNDRGRPFREIADHIEAHL